MPRARGAGRRKHCSRRVPEKDLEEDDAIDCGVAAGARVTPLLLEVEPEQIAGGVEVPRLTRVGDFDRYVLHLYTRLRRQNYLQVLLRVAVVGYISTRIAWRPHFHAHSIDGRFCDAEFVHARECYLTIAVCPRDVHRLFRVALHYRAARDDRKDDEGIFLHLLLCMIPTRMEAGLRDYSFGAKLTVA